MPLSVAARLLLNNRLNAYMGTSGVNYIQSRAALAPVLAKLNADHGWTVNVDEATRVKLRRAYVVEVTRDPAHQAIAEAKGEVAPGANTYEKQVAEMIGGGLGSRLDDDTERADVIHHVLAIVCWRASVAGARPPRLRDLDRIR